MPIELIEKIKHEIEIAKSDLDVAETVPEIENIRIAIFGRNGFFAGISGELKNLPLEAKPEAGKAFNLARNEFQKALDEALNRVSSAKKVNLADIPDLTQPGKKRETGTKHPVSQVIDDCVNIFRRLGFIDADGPEIETIYHNFDALNTPEDHPSRDIQDTFYFSDGRLLRTQTSPVQIRVMENQKPPVRIVAPGRCFRRTRLMLLTA